MRSKKNPPVIPHNILADCLPILTVSYYKILKESCKIDECIDFIKNDFKGVKESIKNIEKISISIFNKIISLIKLYRACEKVEPKDISTIQGILTRYDKLENKIKKIFIINGSLDIIKHHNNALTSMKYSSARTKKWDEFTLWSTYNDREQKDCMNLLEERIKIISEFREIHNELKNLYDIFGEKDIKKPELKGISFKDKNEFSEIIHQLVNNGIMSIFNNKYCIHANSEAEAYRYIISLFIYSENSDYLSFTRVDKKGIKYKAWKCITSNFGYCIEHKPFTSFESKKLNNNFKINLIHPEDDESFSCDELNLIKEM